MKTYQRLLAITGISALSACTSVFAADKVGPHDLMFAKEAAAGGMAEVKLGQLAQDKAASQDVKDFGKRMVDDHSKAGDDLKSVASRDSITLPTDLMPKDQALYDRLSKLSGAAFDRAYVAAMVKDHVKDVADFKKEAGMGKNADVKDFATRTLPTLEEHLKMAQGLSAHKGSGKMSGHKM